MSCKKKGRKKKEVDQQAGSGSLDNYAGTASVSFPDPAGSEPFCWIRIRPKKCHKTNNKSNKLNRYKYYFFFLPHGHIDT